MIIVVGAGIAGSWLTRAAEAAGHSTILVGDQQPASLAAIGLLRPSHLAAPDRQLLAPSIAAWRKAGTVCYESAYVTRWDRDGSKVQPDWWAVDPSGSCLEPDVVGHAEPLSATSVRVNGATMHGTVVWCDGQGEGRRTYGGTWFHPDRDALERLFTVHHMAPYKVLAAVGFTTGARIGSSSSGSLEKAVDQAHRMFDVAAQRGLLRSADGWKLLTGTRLKRESPLALDGPAGAWRWSGFHRTGYGTVPADAERVLRVVTSDVL